MSVYFNKEAAQSFNSNTAESSYVMQIHDGLLLHLYWGPRLDDRDHSYMHWVAGARRVFLPDGKLPPARFSTTCGPEYPTWGSGRLTARPRRRPWHPDGTNIADFRSVSHRITDGKAPLPGRPAMYANEGDDAQTLEIVLEDKSGGMRLSLFYSVFYELDVITRHAVFTNLSEGDVELGAALSAAVDFDRADLDVITNYGTHCVERQIERGPLRRGKTVLASRRGASSHVHNPFLILCGRETSETAGDAYGLALVYSGSFSASAEGTQFGAARALIGLNPDGFGWTLEPGASFTTPEAVLCYAGDGLGGLSHRFHKAFRRNLCRGKFRDARRPVLLNMWEACYFGFDESRIQKIADCSADLGVELLVIDDGWFGRRDTDNCSLGDWTVDRRKLPGGLEAVYENVHKNGMQLGIWSEPEMVSPDSDLYRAHPDWALHISGRPRSEGRHQLILDLTRQDVQDYLYDSIAKILETGMIAYVKWDFNRNMAEVGSALLDAKRQREIPHRYYLGLYALLERLVTAFPDVLFESCSAAAVASTRACSRHAAAWTSDNSDAIERLKIQYGTSLVYPLSAMSAHVSASPNHQTGHVTDFATRLTVALTGSFGYELDPTAISEDERQAIRESAALFKELGAVLAEGDYHRLISPYDSDCAAWSVVSPDKRVCIAGFVLTHVRLYGPNQRLPLRGLDPDADYKERFSGRLFSGRELMGFGVDVHLAHEYKSALWVFEKI